MTEYPYTVVDTPGYLAHSGTHPHRAVIQTATVLRRKHVEGAHTMEGGFVIVDEGMSNTYVDCASRDDAEMLATVAFLGAVENAQQKDG